MQTWDQIINTALLGTDKRALAANELPAELAEAAAFIQNNTPDKEDQFLQIAALAFNYRQCGVLPLQKEGVTVSTAAIEEKAYCSPLAIQTLRDILESESNSLLQFWLQHCEAKSRIVTPDFVPALLTIGTQQKKLQNLVVACSGKRGDWLCKFNPEWNFSTATTQEEIWQTGSAEQRKAVLEQLRKDDPALARTWLQQTWAQEDAGTKVEWLMIMAINIGEDDIEFLEGLAKEKSKKVKDGALWLLKQIPGSPVVQQYRQVLQKTITIGKNGLQIRLPAGLDENLFKTTGLDKLSNSKDFTDEEYIIFQLIQAVPPAFWETRLDSEPDIIIRSMQKDPTGKKLMPALVQAVVAFKDQRWATALMQNSQVFYIDIIPLLPVKEQEFYSIRFMDQFSENIIEHAIKREDTWGIDLTRAIFIKTAKSVYQYNRSFYSRYIHCIPVEIVPELEKCAPAEDYLKTTWNNTSDYITTLINLKKQTIQSFND